MICEGQVLDAHTGHPVAGAEVFCSGPSGVIFGFSDDQGFFQFRDMRKGHWAVSVRKPPYTEQAIRYMLASDVYINICLVLEVMAEEAVTA